MREKVRKAAGKKSTPTVAIVDSQSIRTAEGGEERGYDAGKKITGRKRHLAVDTLGLVLTVVIHSAGVQDQNGAEWVMDKLGEQFHRLKVIFGDSAYSRSGLPGWVRETFGWVLQTVLRPVGVQGFVVLPKRWIVERTFAWLARHRHNSKDYEKTEASSEAITYIAMISLMSKRRANAKNCISKHVLRLSPIVADALQCHHLRVINQIGKYISDWNEHYLLLPRIGR